MNKMQKLIEAWGKGSSGMPLDKMITARLTTNNYARICALVEIYPGRTEEQIASELLATALDEFEVALPYVPGTRVVAEDEFGDPIFEDIGLTPKFEALSHKYSSLLKEK